MQTLASAVTDTERTAALRRQRNLFAAICICLLGSLGVALPRKAEGRRELRALQARRVDLQYRIVAVQAAIREAQDQILEAQREIGKEQAK